jgi:prevent-host-death family protein
MTINVTIDEAQNRLRDLIAGLNPDEEVVITENQRPVARLVSQKTPSPDRSLGFARGMISIVADDDEHLNDFSDYMP